MGSNSGETHPRVPTVGVSFPARHWCCHRKLETSERVAAHSHEFIVRKSNVIHRRPGAQAQGHESRDIVHYGLHLRRNARPDVQLPAAIAQLHFRAAHRSLTPGRRAIRTRERRKDSVSPINPACVSAAH